MPALELRQALGTAYGLAQVQADRSGAVMHLRKVIDEQQAHDIAKAHLADLAAVVAARSQGPQGARCGCHITKLTHDLLAEALNAA